MDDTAVWLFRCFLLLFWVLVVCSIAIHYCRLASGKPRDDAPGSTSDRYVHRRPKWYTRPTPVMVFAFALLIFSVYLADNPFEGILDPYWFLFAFISVVFNPLQLAIPIALLILAVPAIRWLLDSSNRRQSPLSIMVLFMCLAMTAIGIPKRAFFIASLPMFWLAESGQASQMRSLDISRSGTGFYGLFFVQTVESDGLYGGTVYIVEECAISLRCAKVRGFIRQPERVVKQVRFKNGYRLNWMIGDWYEITYADCL